LTGWGADFSNRNLYLEIVELIWRVSVEQASRGTASWFMSSFGWLCLG
jgi:hypothetical protein